MKKRSNKIIPTGQMRRFLLRCRLAAVKIWRPRKKHAHPSETRKGLWDEPPYDHVSYSDATEAATENPLMADKASPSVIHYLYDADKAHSRLHGGQGESRPKTKVHANTGNKDIYGISVLTLDPSLMQGASVPSGRIHESKDDETMSTSSSKTESLVPQDSRETCYTNNRKKVERKKTVNLAHFRSGSAKSVDSDGASLFIKEDSMAYTQFPNSFIAIADEESTASSASEEDSMAYSKFPNSFIAIADEESTASSASEEESLVYAQFPNSFISIARPDPPGSTASF